MQPTILIIGATGNTGQSVIRHLPPLVASQDYRIVGLTRSLSSPISIALSSLPSVEMIEKDWTTITSTWLLSQNVVRAYIAPHNGPTQFTDESTLHLALLPANVKYVVRISTNCEYVGPTNPVYYGRTHWAIENLLAQPEFAKLGWTSLQPNFFTASYLASGAEWIKTYRETGNTDHKLRIVLGEDAPVAMVDPSDVGKLGAHLLALPDSARTQHIGERYVVSGPQDITGSDILRLVESIAGVEVPSEQVTYKDTTWIDELVANGVYPEKVVDSIMAGFECLWEGRCTKAETPTSERVREMERAEPRRTIEDALRAMVE